MLPWQPNNMATDHQAYKLSRQPSNDHHMAHMTSLVMEKMQFNHFPIINQWELSVAMVTKPSDRSLQV